MTQHPHPFYDDYDLQLIDDWNNQGNVQPDLAESRQTSTLMDASRVEEVQESALQDKSTIGI